MATDGSIKTFGHSTRVIAGKSLVLDDEGFLVDPEDWTQELAEVLAGEVGLASVESVHLYCSDNLDNHAAMLTCNVENIDPEDFSAILDGDFDIATRSGLHCAPLVHEDLGTTPCGGVRFSLGPLNTAGDVSSVLEAVQAIVADET
jgi:selenocysteine lyase/cysteine desulfurase